MSEQYFTHDPHAKSNPKTWTYELLGHSLTFTSDVGVFSKNKVDYGSKVLINAFIPPKIEGSIVDLGCGYGPIGISLAKAYPDQKLILSDVNQRAVDLAKRNIKQNQLTNAEVFLSDQFESLPDQLYDAVVVNPPIRAGKKIVHEMFEAAYRYLKTSGELWVVIQKKQGAPSALKKMEAIFSEVEVVEKNNGYFVIRGIKSEQ